MPTPSKRWRLVARLLLLCLLAQLHVAWPAAVAAASPEDQNAPKADRKAPPPPVRPEITVSPPARDGDFVEDVSQRTAFRKILRKGNESRIILAMAPMHYEVAKGAWSDIDNTLEADTDGFSHRNKANAFSARFTSKSGGNQVRFEHNGRSVTLDLPEKDMGNAPVSGKVKKNQMRYEAPGAPVAVEYEVGSAGLFENIWLLRRGAPAKYDFTLRVEGVTPVRQPNGSVWFVKDDSITERAFYIPAPYVEDAAGARGNAEMDVKPLGDGRWQLRAEVDRQWLNDDTRVWPVRLDPTLYIDTAGGQWLQVGPNSVGSDDRFLRLGYDPFTLVHMQFDLRDYVKVPGQILSNATLWLVVPASVDSGGNFICNYCPLSFTISQEKKEWFKSTASYYQPGWQGTTWPDGGGERCSTAPCGPPIQARLAWADATGYNSIYWDGSRRAEWGFNVTDMVRTWLDGTVPNNGFFFNEIVPGNFNYPAVTFFSPAYYQYGSRLQLTYTNLPLPTAVGQPDTTVPTSPRVTVSSQASLIKTELYVDGVLAGTDTTRTAGALTFNIDATKFPYGAHQLQARTYTSAGEMVESTAAVATFGEGGVTPPVNLTVVPRPGGGMRLNWAKSTASNPGRTISYTILRANDSAFTSPTTVATGVSALSYDDALATGTPFYKVQAVTSAGVASALTPAVQSLAPIQPFGLTYQNMAGGGIKLSWSPSPTAHVDQGVTYQVFRNGTLLAGGVNSTTYTDTAVTAGTSYTYSVVAQNGAGQTRASESLPAIPRQSYSGPEAPTQVQAVAGRSRTIGLTWTPANDPATTYEVIRYTGSNPWADPGTGSPLATGISTWFWNDTDASLAEGQQYWYRVRSVRSGQAGPWSAPAGAVATSVRRTGTDPRQAFVQLPFGTNSARVNLSSGNLVLSAVDVSVPVPYLPHVLARTYNAQDCGACTILGVGWRLGAEWTVAETADGAIVTAGEGTEHRFTWTGSAYVPEARYYGTLARDAGTGGWTLNFPDLTQYNFRPDGRLDFIQERNGNQLQYLYGGPGLLTQMVSKDASGAVLRSTTLSYDSAGRLQTVTDPAGRQTTYQYDNAGRLAQVRNQAGETTTYQYDSLNRLTRVQDGAGRWNYVAYGVNGAVTYLLDGLGTATAINTHAAGTTVVSDASGNATTYVLDGRGWPQQIVDALGNTTAFEYTFSGATFSKYTITNARGLKTEYTYDTAGRVTRAYEHAGATADTQELVAPGVSSRTNDSRYDTVTGDLTDQSTQVSHDPGTGDQVYHGNHYTYSYNGNRIQTISVQRYTQTNSATATMVGPVSTTTLGANGWVTQVGVAQSGDPNDGVTHLEYNANGTLRSVTRRDIDANLRTEGAIAANTPPRDVVQEFTYYADGQVMDVVDWHLAGTAGTAATHHEYDQVGRPVRTTGPDGASTYTFYDPSGLPVLTIDQAGRSQVVLHDAARRTAATIQADGGIITYQYNSAGLHIATTDPLNHTTALQYDALHRVVRVTDPNNMAQAWVYDKVGNVTAVATGSADMLNQNKGYTVRSSYYLANLPKETREPIPVEAITPTAGVSLPPTDPGDPAGTTYNISAYEYNPHSAPLRSLPFDFLIL